VWTKLHFNRKLFPLLGEEMLLRRITKHVKEQNWVAVGIDMLVVILGIFIGFQLNSWKEERQDAVKGQGYLERIAAELEQDIRFFENVINGNNQNIENAFFLLETLEDEDLVREDPTRFITSISGIGYSFVVNVSNNTFEEIKYSGNLELIPDSDLRNDIADYYDFIEIEQNFSHIRKFAETEYFRRNTNILSADPNMDLQRFSERKYSEVDALLAHEKFIQNQELIDWIPSLINSKKTTTGFSIGAQRRAKELLAEITGEPIE